MPFFDFFKATPKNRKTRRAEKSLRLNPVEALEDRVVPSISVQVNTPYNVAFPINEGQTFTITGKLLDDSLVATANSLVLSPIIAPPNATIGTVTYGAPTPSGPFNSRTFSFDFKADNGLFTAPATPLLSPFTIVGVNDQSDQSPDTTLRPRLFNLAPVLTASSTQSAIAGKSIGIDLGTFTDPGTELSWTVGIDWDNNGTFEDSFSASAKGKIFRNYLFASAGSYPVKVQVSDPDGGFSSTENFTVNVSSDVATTYVNDDWSVTNDIGAPGLSTGDTVTGGYIFGYNAWSTITDALAVTSDAGTVNVLAGTYSENLSVSKAVSILGPNVGTPGNGSRASEAIIIPSVDDAASGVVVNITAANVTVDGFTIDGNNSTLTKGIDVNSVDVNANVGVLATGVGNVSILNNKLANFTGAAVNGASSSAVGGSSISFNSIDNVALNSSPYFGRGVLIQDNFYASVSNNVMTRVRTGIQTNNFGLANPGAAAAISNNTITAYVRGIFHNLQYGFASPFTISTNTLTAGTGAPVGNGGLILSSIQDAVSVTVTGNNVSGFTNNLNVWNIPTTAGITITGGTIASAVGFGLNFTNRDPGFGDATGSGNLMLSGVTFSSTNPTAIRVFDDPDNKNGSSLSLTLNGVTINGTSSSTGLLVSGSDAGMTLGNTVFSGFTGTSKFIELTDGAAFGTTIDGTTASYNGVLGSNLTRTSSPSGFAVEDRISHYLDAEGVGFVRTTPNTTFVTQTSGSIQRAINISAASGDTVFVGVGTFAENLLVNKSVALRGNQDAVDPRPTDTGARSGGESIILPSVANGASDATLIRVTSNTVSVRGFTIRGSNTLLGTGLSINGAAVHAGRGIANGTDAGGWTAVNNLVVENNILTDFGRFAVGLINLGLGVTTTGGVINQNVIDNVVGYATSSPSSFGARQGVFLRENAFADITNNEMTRVERGIHTQFYNGGGAVPASIISGNDITSGTSGIYLSDPSSTNQPIVSTNTLRSTTSYTSGGFNTGIAVLGSSGSSLTIGNNTVTPGALFGYLLWSNTNTGGVTISGGSVSGTKFGVLATNNNIFFTNPTTTTQSSTATVTGVSFINNETAVAAVDSSTPLATGSVMVTVNGATSITGTLTQTGVVADGPNATLNFASGSISGQLLGAAATSSATPTAETPSGTLNITGGTISQNTTGVSYNLGGRGSVGSVNFDGATDNGTDLFIASNAGTVSILGGIAFAADNYYIDNQSQQSYDLSALVGITFDETNNFRIEDKIHHRVDTNLALTTGLVTWVPKSVFVTTPTGTDSSIQRGVDAVPNASTGWTVNVEAGTYDETVNVNEDITLLGSGKGSTTIQPSNTGLNKAVVTVSAPGVTIDGFTIAVIQPTNRIGIYASGNAATVWNGLLVQNNTLISAGMTDNTSRGIFVSDSGPGFAGAVTIQSNAITAGVGSAFWWGIELFQVKSSTIGGPNLADGNTFEKTVTLDVRTGFAAANGTTTIRNNTFSGGGVEVTEPNGGSVTTIQDNSFTPAVDGYRQSIFVNHNYTAGATVSIVGNQFTVRNQGEAAGRPGVGVFVGGSAGVSLSGNQFNAVAGATNFVYLLVDTQQREGSDGKQYGDDVPDSLTATGNTFNGSDVIGGRAIAFYNGNSTRIVTGSVSGNQYGVYNIGGAGALANSFAGNLGQFIQLNSIRNPIFAGNLGPTVPGAVTLNLDATGNLFDVGSGLQLPANMSLTSKFALEQKLTHKPDSNALGLITVVPNNIYVPAVTNTIQGGIDAVPDGSTGWTVTVQAGTYAETVTVNEKINLLGSSAGIGVGKSDKGTRTGETIIVPAFSLSPGSINSGLALVNVTVSSVVIDGFTIDGNNTGFDSKYEATGATGDIDAARGILVSGSTPLTDVIIRNNYIQNFTSRGIQYGLRSSEKTTKYGAGASESSATGTVEHNAISGIGFDGDPFSDGYAVLSYYSSPTVNTNLISDTYYGVFYQLPNFGLTTGTTLSDNAVTAISIGLGLNGATNAGNILISGNSVTMSADGDALGVQLTSLPTGVVSITGNTVANTSTGNKTGSQGYYIWSGGTNSALTITGGSVSGFETGIVATNENWGFGASSQPLMLTLDGVIVTVTANGTGVSVDDTMESTSPVTVVFANNTTITGTTSGQGVSLSGPDAKIGNVTGNGSLGSIIFSSFTGTSNYLVLTGGAYNAAANSGLVIDAGSAVFNGVTAGSATLSEAFAIEDKILDQLDDSALGFVQLQANKAFVTSGGANGAVQRAVRSEGISSNGKIYVNSGTYLGDVLLDVSGIQLIGAGLTRPILSGVRTSDSSNLGSSTIAIAANNVIVTGFDITRDGNTVTDWDDSLNTAGLSVQGTSWNGIQVLGNSFYGNRTAIDLNNVNGVTVSQNRINDNRTGIVMRNFVTNSSITKNEITNNWTVGVLWLVGGLGEDFTGSILTNNAIVGNWYADLENRSTSGGLKNVSGNWFGTNALTVLSTNGSEPGYTALIPTTFGGGASNPGGAPNIRGVGVNDLDFSPYLWTGTDNDSGLGFQGDFTQLGVTTAGAQIQLGGRINEAIGYNGGTATDIYVLSGAYAEALNLNRAVAVHAQGNLSTNSIAGTAAAGQLDLNGFTYTYGDGSSTTFNGAFVGSGNIVKQGTGTSTLTGTSTFSGTTTVSDGQLLVNGILPGTFVVNNGVLGGTGIIGTIGSAQQVNSGGSLLMTGGTVNGNLTVATGGIVNGTSTTNLVGNVVNNGLIDLVGTVTGSLTNNNTLIIGNSSIGKLTVTNGFTQSANGSLVLTVNGDPINPGTTHDQLLVTGGNTSLDGNLQLSVTNGSYANFTTRKLIDNTGTGTATGQFSKLNAATTDLSTGKFINPPAAGVYFQIANTGGTGNDFTLFVVPNGNPVTETFASTAFSGPNGTDVSSTTGVANSFIGYNAFAKIQTAINFSTPTGSIRVLAGNYGVDSIDLGANAQTVNLATGANVVVNGVLNATNAGSKLNFNRGSLTIGDGTTSATFAGILTGLTNTIGFVKQGSGELVLSNAGNNYNGPTLVNGGKLTLATDEVLPDSSAVTVSSGAILNLGTNWETIGSLKGAGSVTFSTAAQLTTGGNNTNTTFSGVISGGGALVKVGAGTMTLTGAQTYTGGTSVITGVLQIGDGVTAGSVIGDIYTDSGSVAVNLPGPSDTTFPNKVTGDGSLIKNGTGTTTLTGANDYKGGTIINGGTLAITTDSALGASSGGVTINNSGKLRVDSSLETFRDFNIGDAGSIVIASGKLTLTNSTVSGGTIAGPGKAELNNATLNTVTVSSTANLILNDGTTLNAVTNKGRLAITSGSKVISNDLLNTASGKLFIEGTADVDGFISEGYVQISNGGLLSNLGDTQLFFTSGRLNIGVDFNNIAIAGLGGDLANRIPRGQVYLGAPGLTGGTGLIIRNNGNISSGIGYPDQVVYTTMNLSNGAIYYFGDGPSEGIDDEVNFSVSISGGSSLTGGF